MIGTKGRYGLRVMIDLAEHFGEERIPLKDIAERQNISTPFYERYRERLFTLPMPGEHARSHNLANSVSIALYEALRQTRFSQ